MPVFWRDMKKIVFSKTLREVGWNSQLIGGNIAKTVNRLKTQPGKDMSVGGAGIAASFMRPGLIDEYCLYVNPIIPGNGKPMFQNRKNRISIFYPVLFKNLMACVSQAFFRLNYLWQQPRG
jgi:dihydrofolate reductase